MEYYIPSGSNPRLQGFDRANQRRFWKYFVNFEKIKEQHPFTFTSSFVKKSIYVRDINKDIDRTLPNDPFFQREERYSPLSLYFPLNQYFKSKNALFRVLVAIANTVKEVGYIQGLNSIAGTLLTNLKEEDAYWMMIYLLKKRELKNLVAFKFPLVNLWNFQLKCLMRCHLPDIYAHLVSYFSLGFDPNLSNKISAQTRSRSGILLNSLVSYSFHSLLPSPSRSKLEYI